MAILHRLTQDFEDILVELRHFIEKQDAVVGQRDFAGTRGRAAADQAGIRDGVVRRAIGTGRDQGGARRQMAGHRVNLGGLQRLAQGHVGQDGGETAREHRLA